MDFSKFQTILNTFADPGSTVEISKGNVLVQINDKAHYAKVRMHEGALMVEDDTGESMSAVRWIILRIARLHTLADRILQFVPHTEHFINPEAKLFDDLDDEHPIEDASVENAVDCAGRLLSRRFAYTTSVLYLTSNAGEGKTTLLHELAREQAAAYKNKRSDWLLVPIALGGRPFMRFDDMIVGYLTNKLRFPLFYYDAFIELVKLGVIIPAFDGFEETLVVNASGDAYSAIGALMASLDQQGTVVISARKAFFEYQELKLQARLYDSIGNNSVVFSRLQLERWKRKQFVEYATLRGYPSPDALYYAVGEALHSPNHALLTRAVLANRLLSVATAEKDLTALLQRLGASPDDYFPVFVDTIITREAHEKWLDSGGEAAQPLLSVSEHHELLAMIAQEMWVQSTESLKAEILEVIAALFCEARKKTSAALHQIQQRIKQHALLVPSDTSKNQFGFDHEEFRNYYLGLALAKQMGDLDTMSRGDFVMMLRRGALPDQVLESVRCSLDKCGAEQTVGIVGALSQIAKLEPQSSYLHENCAQLLLRVLTHQELGPLVLEDFTFGVAALEGVSYSDIEFRRCVFRTTSLRRTTLFRCGFIECSFDRLDLSGMGPAKEWKTHFDRCAFGGMVHPTKDLVSFDPSEFDGILRSAGFEPPKQEQPTLQLDPKPIEPDPEFLAVQKIVRCFANRTHVTDVLLKTKGGKQAASLLEEIIPRLIEAGVIYQDTYRGGGKQHVFKLRVGMMQLHDVLARAKGNYNDFLRLIAAPMTR